MMEVNIVVEVKKDDDNIVGISSNGEQMLVHIKEAASFTAEEFAQLYNIFNIIKSIKINQKTGSGSVQ